MLISKCFRITAKTTVRTDIMKFEQAFERAKQAAEDDYTVDALHMLAIVASSDKGLLLNLQAIRLAESSSQERARNWLASLYNNTGWSYHAKGDDVSALEFFKKADAWQRSKGRGNETRIARPGA